VFNFESLGIDIEELRERMGGKRCEASAIVWIIIIVVVVLIVVTIILVIAVY